MRTFEGGATRDTNDNKVDYRCLSIRALRAYGEYMHRHRIQADGERRSAANYKKGIPADAYTESAIRHMMEFMSEVEEKGAASADVVCAVLFNLFGLLHGHPETEGPAYVSCAPPVMPACIAYIPKDGVPVVHRTTHVPVPVQCDAYLYSGYPCTRLAGHDGGHHYNAGGVTSE